MSNLIGKVRAAVDTYSMIDDSDKIAVCVSGGKDSIFLLWSLSQLQKYYPKKFTLAAITIDPCFNGKQSDFSAVEEFCTSLNIEYKIKRTQLGDLIFKTRQECNPCSLCARMRRGMLHDMAKELNCNKIALGHNLEDCVETFFMNLLNGGKIGCFSPKTYLSRKDLHMIRPLIFCEENKIAAFVERKRLPIVESTCPANGNTQRQATKELVLTLEKQYPNLRHKIIGALQRASIDEWGKLKPLAHTNS